MSELEFSKENAEKLLRQFKGNAEISLREYMLGNN